MNNIISVENEVKNEIMSTDVYIKLVSENVSEGILEGHISSVLEDFRDFEGKFSRFQKNNILDKFNKGSGEIFTDPELFNILEKSIFYFNKTNGIFDPGILPFLENEGYIKSKSLGFFDLRFKKKQNRTFQYQRHTNPGPDIF